MKREILYTLKSPFRDDFKIQGFRFGSGTKRVAIVGPMRGDEVQQQFVCSQIVQALSRIEAAGELLPDQEILVVPSANPFSMNIGSRFWAMDDTDINRMFPGYSKGETTQRIAAALFEQLQGYQYGIQLASYYLPGRFVPHVRMMETGYQDEETAGLFGLPYVCLRKPLPFDTTLLNYNWQIWDTKAFSLYAGKNDTISESCTREACRSILRFMNRMELIHQPVRAGFHSTTITDDDLTSVKAEKAGVFYRMKGAREEVKAGEILAHILDPYDGSVQQEVKAPVSGAIFFAHDKPLTLQNTLLYKIIREE